MALVQWCSVLFPFFLIGIKSLSCWSAVHGCLKHLRLPAGTQQEYPSNPHGDLASDIPVEDKS